MPRSRSTDPNPHLVKIPKRRKWYVRWTEPGTSRSRVQSTGIEDRELAEQWLDKWRAKRATPGNDPTIGELLDKWAAARIPHVANPDQIRLHVKQLKAHFGSKTISTMTDAHWDAYKPEHPAADRRQKQDLIAALNYAAKKDWIPKAPKFSLPAKRDPRDSYLTKEQGQALLAAARPLHLKLFIMIALSTGARRGAILGLTWDRVLWDQSVLDFRDPTLAITKKRRVSVMVQGPLMAALRDAKELALSDNVIEFNGKPIKSIQKAFKVAAADAGVPSCTPHILKHTAISWLAQLGWTVDQISDFTGTDPETIRRIYKKFAPEHLQDLSASLSDQLFAPTPLAQTNIREVS